MREVLAHIHNIATSLENKKAFKQAEQLNRIFTKIAAEVEAAKKKKKTKKNVPTNPSLWAECKAWAKRTFDVYPSAYANGAAAKRYKSKGGSWKKASTNDNFTRLAKKSPEELLGEIYETANKINKLEPSKDYIQSMIDQMMSKDKKSLFDDKKEGKEDGRDLDGSKELDHQNMDLMNHSEMKIDAESNLEDAINNFDSKTYKVDPHGDWMENEWITVDQYIEMIIDKYGRNIMYAPSAIDGNHIAFDSPDGFQIVNMVHKSNWDTGK